jgi:hypothetical protein
MLQIAAKHGDGWSSWGGSGVETEEDFYRMTGERSKQFDDFCVAYDRNPRTIRHSVVCYPPLTPWESPEHFVDMVGRFSEIGVDEFVLYLPESWRVRPSEWEVMEEVASTLMPAMRRPGGADQLPDR